MKQNARQLAMQVLIKVSDQDAFSHIALDQVLKSHPGLDPRDRGFITEVVYGTIQHKRLIDFNLQPFLKQDIAKLDSWVRELFRLSFYQLMFLDRVPERAVVHESVELAKQLGHKGIVGMMNGVLRNFLRAPKASLDSIQDPTERLAVRTSHPDWLVTRWIEQYGWDQAVNICEANNEHPDTTVRVNSLKSTRDDLLLQLEKEGFVVEKTVQSEEGIRFKAGGNVTQSRLFQQGYFTVQDESSMLIAPLLQPEPGMRVLDACAAPGGKATHLAELMNNQGDVVANDIHAHKETYIQESANRLGITILNTIVSDAQDLDKHAIGLFDRILVDAPCTGFGVIRRKPDLKWAKTKKDIKEIAHLQYRILEKVAPLLKSGGQLVYSTCTLEKEENQDVLDHFLKKQPSFEQLAGQTQQILPHDFGADGFFMSKLKKN